MPKLELSITNGFYESETTPLVNQSCVNLYPKHPETKDALSPGALYRTPGITQTDTVADTGRGMIKDSKNGYLYIVAGNTLYRKNDIGTITNIGYIGGTGRVSMAWNGITLCIIAPGEYGYFYTIAAGLSQITDSIFLDFMTLSNGGVTSVCYKDSRFIYSTDDEFFVGSVISTNYGQDFDALDYEDAEVKADPIIRALNIKNELYIFGKETIELYQVTTGTGFPYIRIPGATIEKGLLARFSIVPFDNSFVFLGADTLETPAIWRGEPGGAKKLSTSAIDKLLQSYTESQLESVTAWTYNDGGSWFVGFNLPDRTIVYDGVASAIQQRSIWHERKSNNTTYRVEDCINMFGYNIVIDNVAGVIGYFDREVTTEYSNSISRTFSGGYLQDQGDSFRINNLELKCSAGVGNTKGTTDSDPEVEMFISKDGGNTFISLGTRKIGMQGYRRKRLIWRRIGRVPHNVMFKFEMNDTVAVDFYRIDIEFKHNIKKIRGQQ
jgi:hypothetical protein